MTLTDWLAIYGAAVSTLAGAWTFYLWWVRGPHLTLSVSSNMMVIDGGPQREGKTYLSITVNNRGTDATTITGIGLEGFDTITQRWFGKRCYGAIINRALQAYSLPGRIEVGNDWRSLCEQTPEIERLARNKLLYVWVSHTFTDRLLRKQVVILDNERVAPQN